MSTKIYIVCDVCQSETPAAVDPNHARTGLDWSEVIKTDVLHGFPIRVEVKLGPGKHVCPKCVLTAIQRHVNTPKKAEPLPALAELLSVAEADKQFCNKCEQVHEWPRHAGCKR